MCKKDNHLGVNESKTLYCTSGASIWQGNTRVREKKELNIKKNQPFATTTTTNDEKTDGKEKTQHGKA